MLDVRFEINGRRVDPKRIGNALEQVVYEKIVADIRRKVGAVRDPETGRPPKITVKGRNLKSLSIEVQGSEEVINRVKRRLA
jgi:hypothetical protein